MMTSRPTQAAGVEKIPETTLPCPLCRSPHVNLARDLKGDPQQIFCKACGCSASIAAWNTRHPDHTLHAELSAARAEVERVREALAEARRELYDERHSHMSEEEFKNSVDYIDAVLEAPSHAQ